MWMRIMIMSFTYDDVIIVSVRMAKMVKILKKCLLLIGQQKHSPMKITITMKITIVKIMTKCLLVMRVPPHMP